MASSSSTRALSDLETKRDISYNNDKTNQVSHVTSGKKKKDNMSKFLEKCTIYNRHAIMNDMYKLKEIMPKSKPQSSKYLLDEIKPRRRKFSTDKSVVEKKTSESKWPISLDNVDKAIDNLITNIPDEVKKCALIPFCSGSNLFITGASGTGKSEMLRHMQSICQSLNIEYVLLASTHDGAINLKCPTVNSWMNFPSVYQNPNVLLKHAKKEKKKWTTPQVVIIDNFPLLDCVYLKVLNNMFCHLRDNDAPFGGVCMILTGDAAQCPNYRNADTFKKHFFLEKEWIDAKFETLHFKKNYRFDNTSSELLDRLRFGKCTPDDAEFFKTLVKKKSNRIVYPELFKLSNATSEVKNFNPPIHLTRMEVIAQEAENDNEEMMKNIQPSAESRIVFQAEEKRGNNSRESQNFLTIMRTSPIKESITLYTGVQVVLLVDIEVPCAVDDEKKDKTQKVSRGEIGVIVGWNIEVITAAETITLKHPYVKFNGLPDKVLIKPHYWYEKPNVDTDDGASYKQIPIVPAWSLSLATASELCIEEFYLRPKKLIFDARQFYSCLTKIKDLNKMSLESFDESWLSLPPKIIEFHRSILD